MPGKLPHGPCHAPCLGYRVALKAMVSGSLSLEVDGKLGPEPATASQGSCGLSLPLPLCSDGVPQSFFSVQAACPAWPLGEQGCPLLPPGEAGGGARPQALASADLGFTPTSQLGPRTSFKPR